VPVRFWPVAPTINMTADFTSIPGFFIGSSAKYALVDARSYRIWLVDNTSSYLMMLRDGFLSKRQFVVVELSKNNIESTNINNAQALHWAFSKEPGIDRFPGKEWMIGFPRIAKDDSWPMVEQSTVSANDLDLLGQLFLYRKLLFSLHTVNLGPNKVVQPAQLKEIIKEIAEYTSKGITLEDMHNNLYELADSLYSRFVGMEAACIFQCLPEHMKYE
jgi:hypothetical protein